MSIETILEAAKDNDWHTLKGIFESWDRNAATAEIDRLSGKPRKPEEWAGWADTNISSALYQTQERRKKLIAEFWKVVYPLDYEPDGYTRDEVEKMLDGWNNELLKADIEVAKNKTAKNSVATGKVKAMIESAKDFRDILMLFSSIFPHIMPHTFDGLSDSVPKIKAAIATYNDLGADIEDRYAAYLVLTNAPGPAFGMAAEGKDPSDVLDNSLEARVNQLMVVQHLKAKYSKASESFMPNEFFSGLAKVADFEERIANTQDMYGISIKQAGDKYTARIATAQAEVDAMAVSTTARDEEIVKFKKDNPAPNYYSPERAAWDASVKDIWTKHGAIIEEQRAQQLVKWREIVQPLLNERQAKYDEIGQQFVPKCDALKEQKAETKKILYGGMKQKILESSAVTQEQADQWVSENVLMDQRTIAKAKRAGYEIEQMKSDLAEFYRFTNGRLPRMTVDPGTRKNRASADHLNETIYVGKGFSKRTLWHECAHCLEADPNTYAVAIQFLKDRTDNFKEIKTLRSLTGNPNYKPDEVAFVDSFFSYYVGKRYSNATEVFSMGMQMFSDPEAMHELMTADPDHFEVMLGFAATVPKLDQDKVKAKQDSLQVKKDQVETQESFLKSLDKKIKGEFWKGTDWVVESTQSYNGKSTSWQIANQTKRNAGGSYSAYPLHKEKNARRVLYMWLATGNKNNSGQMMDWVLDIEAQRVSDRRLPEAWGSFLPSGPPAIEGAAQ